MRTLFTWGEQNGSDESERQSAAAAVVNWVPTVLILGLFVWWSLLTFLLQKQLPDLRDAAEAIAVWLLASVILVVAPALVRSIAPKSSRGVRGVAVLFIWALVSIPLCYALFWSSYDAMNPVPMRPEGQLPDVAALLGRSPHDAARILGTNKVVGEAMLPPGEASGPWRPGGVNAQKLVVYSMTDMNRLDSRPGKRAAQEAESKKFALQLEGGTTPVRWGSDAVVLVYYSAKSKVVGVRMDVSMRAAKEALSSVASDTVLAATGIGNPVPVVGAGDVDAVTDLPESETVFWGGGTARNIDVGYQLRIGGFANFVTERTPVTLNKSVELGDVTLIVAPDLNGPTNQLLAQTVSHETSMVVPVDNALPNNVQSSNGRTSHSDETFWIIICSRPCSTEAEAVAEAADLNKGRAANAGHFSVERSGHLAGLGTTDFWVVIYDIGYAHEQEARDVMSSEKADLPTTDVRLAYITKSCGDYTIANVAR